MYDQLINIITKIKDNKNDQFLSLIYFNKVQL